MKKTKNKYSDFLNIYSFFSLLLLLACSFMLGLLWNKDSEREKCEFWVSRNEINEKVPFAEISGISNGEIFGEVKKGRLKIGDEEFLPEGKFTFPVSGLIKKAKLSILKELSKNLDLEKAKEDGFQFLGSISSKKYHPIDSGTAKRISVENRIFFKNTEEAEALGFLPSKQIIN